MSAEEVQVKTEDVEDESTDVGDIVVKIEEALHDGGDDVLNGEEGTHEEEEEEEGDRTHGDDDTMEVEEGKGEEQKEEETESKPKKVLPKVDLPNEEDFRKDRYEEQFMQRVIIGKLSMEDLTNDRISAAIKKSTQFFIRFSRDEADHRGHLELRFGTRGEARVMAEELSDLREDIYAKQLNSDFRRSEEYRELKGIGQDENEGTGKLEDRTALAYGIPVEGTDEQIKALFPDAVSMLRPTDASNKPKCHCYLEYPNANEMQDAVAKYKQVELEINGETLRIFRLPKLPTFDGVCQQIELLGLEQHLSGPMPLKKKRRYENTIKRARAIPRRNLTPAQRSTLGKKIKQMQTKIAQSDAQSKMPQQKSVRGRGGYLRNPRWGGPGMMAGGRGGRGGQMGMGGGGMTPPPLMGMAGQGFGGSNMGGGFGFGGFDRFNNMDRGPSFGADQWRGGEMYDRFDRFSYGGNRDGGFGGGMGGGDQWRKRRLSDGAGTGSGMGGDWKRRPNEGYNSNRFGNNAGGGAMKKRTRGRGGRGGF